MSLYAHPHQAIAVALERIAAALELPLQRERHEALVRIHDYRGDFLDRESQRLRGQGPDEQERLLKAIEKNERTLGLIRRDREDG